MVGKLEVGELQRRVMAIVRAAMADHGWSGRRLAEEAGVTRNRCAELLGDRRVATVDELDAMCTALGLVHEARHTTITARPHVQGCLTKIVRPPTCANH